MPCFAKISTYSSFEMNWKIFYFTKKIDKKNMLGMDITRL